MIFLTGRKPVSSVARQRRSAFTLIELILVMTVMLVILSLTGASLSRFFQGRGLHSEARRFLSLTRYAQSRAVAESIPMILWVDMQRRRYGVESEYSFTTSDEHSVDYELGQDLEIRMETTIQQNALSTRSSSGMASSRSGIQIRFSPDGFLPEAAPRNIWLLGTSTGDQGDTSASVWITPNALGSAYEIQSGSASGYANRP